MGDVSDMGLSEYLSRAARALLVWACYRALQERRRRDGLSIWGATSDLAGEVGVTDRTVERWLSRGIQSCNVNADRILEVAMGLCPREVTEIVLDDLGAHARALGFPEVVSIPHGLRRAARRSWVRRRRQRFSLTGLDCSLNRHPRYTEVRG
ncbi:MAG: hypothetical protein WC941_10960 [Candidatus Bathyarchaeia archaeon]